MKRIYSYFVVFTGLLCWGKADAQQFLERVYLLDSITVHEGLIIEQAPSKYVKIFRIQFKDTITVPLNQVWKLTKFYPVDSVKADTTLKIKVKKTSYHKIAFVELMGTAGIYSVNFGMRTERGKRNGWGYRAGYEYLSVKASDSVTNDKVNIAFRAFPFQLNYLLGKRKGFLELGVGATFISPKVSGSGNANISQDLIEGFNQTVRSVIGTFTVGYRHVPYKKGIMYKFAFTPLLVEGLLIPFAGLGIGYHFK